jgi:hypothetical protein
MKKLFTILTFLVLAISVKAQDSVQVTLQWQARDIEYAAKYIADMPKYETLFDSVKPKFRVVTPPTGTTNVSVTSYTVDWLNIYDQLNTDVYAVHNGVTQRLKALLLAANQPFITTFVNALDVINQDAQSNARVYGRFRLKRNNN